MSEVVLSRGGDRVLAAIDGAAPVPVRLLPFRPLHEPDGPLAVVDGKGRILAELTSLQDLDPASRAVAEAALAEHLHAPLVQEVLSVAHVDGNRYLDLATTAGGRSCVVRTPEHAFIVQPDGSTLLRDAAGVRYRIPPDLDAGSQRKLDSIR